MTAMITKAPIAINNRRVATSTTRANDDVLTEHGRILRVLTADADLSHRWSEDVLRGGDFNRLVGHVWAKVAGESDVEGATLQLAPAGPWKETGTTGAVTLNKTSSLSGERDAKMALDDAATRFSQQSWFPLRLGIGYTLHTIHIQSNLTDTIDVQIRWFNGTIFRYRTGSATWSDTPTWLLLADSVSAVVSNTLFQPEGAARHEVRFRPTGAAASETAQIGNVYIAEDGLATDPLLPAGDVVFFKAEGEGRLSFLKAASAGVVDISEVGSA